MWEYALQNYQLLFPSQKSHINKYIYLYIYPVINIFTQMASIARLSSKAFRKNHKIAYYWTGESTESFLLHLEGCWSGTRVTSYTYTHTHTHTHSVVKAESASSRTNWLRHWDTSRNSEGSILDGVKEFFIDFRPHYDSGFDSASNINEYQGYPLGGR